MAKKIAKTKPSKVTEPVEIPIGTLNIKVYKDGTYDIDAKVNAEQEALTWYANTLADLADGKINQTIVERFLNSQDTTDQAIGQYLGLFLKTYNLKDKPIVSPDKVFRKGRIK